MSKIIGTALAAMLLLGAFAIPSFAEDDPELSERDILALAVAAAQAEVVRLEGELVELGVDLQEIQTDLDEAKLDEVEAKEELDAAKEAYDAKAGELAAAIITRDSLQTLYDACPAATSGAGNGNGCRERVLDGQGGLGLTEARSIVEDLAEEEAELLEALNEAEDAHTIAVLVVELAEAKIALAVAEAELAAYDAANATPDPSAHPGCKGISNAQTAVAKTSNGKGKAAETLANVADKLGC